MDQYSLSIISITYFSFNSQWHYAFKGHPFCFSCFLLESPWRSLFLHIKALQSPKADPRWCIFLLKFPQLLKRLTEATPGFYRFCDVTDDSSSELNIIGPCLLNQKEKSFWFNHNNECAEIPLTNQSSLSFRRRGLKRDKSVLKYCFVFVFLIYISNQF